MLGTAAAALGAIGSHALELDAEGARRFAIANRYHFYHVLAVLAVALGGNRLAVLPRRLVLFCWLAGVVLFCGSLYAVAIAGHAAVMPLVPVGGVFLIAGWLGLVVAAWPGGRH